MFDSIEVETPPNDSAPATIDPPTAQVLVPTDDVEGDSGSSSLPADLFLELPAEYGKVSVEFCVNLVSMVTVSHIMKNRPH